MEIQNQVVDNYGEQRARDFHDVMRASLLMDYNASHFRFFDDRIKGATVMELGCGTGAFLETALERGAATTYGVDVSHEMLAIANSEIEARGLNMEVSLGDCFKEKIVHDAGPFDYVSANFVAVYVPDME